MLDADSDDVPQVRAILRPVVDAVYWLACKTLAIFSLLWRARRGSTERANYARDPDWRTESHALVEIGNVLSRYVRVREMTGARKAAPRLTRSLQDTLAAACP